MFIATTLRQIALRTERHVGSADGYKHFTPPERIQSHPGFPLSAGSEFRHHGFDVLFYSLTVALLFERIRHRSA